MILTVTLKSPYSVCDSINWFSLSRKQFYFGTEFKIAV